MKLVYYAHPVTDYGTKHETEVVRMLERAGFVVLNPNNPATDLEYKLAKITDREAAMQVFYRMIDRCDVLVFESFEDNMIGSGVWLEIQHAKFRLLPVLEVPRLDFTKLRALSYSETVERIKATKGAT